MTPFQLGAIALAERGVRTIDLAGDNRRPDGTVSDLLIIARAAHG